MGNETRNPLLWLVFAILLAVGLVALLSAAFPPTSTTYGMMGIGWGWGVAMMVVPTLVLILILLAAVGAFNPSPVPPAYVSPSPSLEVLNARYARGEITREEYLRIRADLEGRHP